MRRPGRAEFIAPGGDDDDYFSTDDEGGASLTHGQDNGSDDSAAVDEAIERQARIDERQARIDERRLVRRSGLLRDTLVERYGHALYRTVPLSRNGTVFFGDGEAATVTHTVPYRPKKTNSEIVLALYRASFATESRRLRSMNALVSNGEIERRKRKRAIEVHIMMLHQAHGACAAKLVRWLHRNTHGASRILRPRASHDIGPFARYAPEPLLFKKFTRLTVQQFLLLHLHVEHLMHISQSVVRTAIMQHHCFMYSKQVLDIYRDRSVKYGVKVELLKEVIEKAAEAWAAGVRSHAKLITQAHRFKYNSKDRLFIVLYFMVTGCRLVDLHGYINMRETALGVEVNCRMALLSVYLYERFVKWPNAEGEDTTQRGIRDALKGTPWAGMVGIVDGTEIPVRRGSDFVQHRTYSGHKRAHTTTTQFTCDLLGRVIHTTESLPGSFNDRRVFNAYCAYNNPTRRAEFLGADEFVIGMWQASSHAALHARTGDLGYNGDSSVVHTTRSFNQVLFANGWSARQRLIARGVFIAMRQQVENTIGNVKRSYRILKYHMDSRQDHSFTLLLRLGCALYNMRLTLEQRGMRTARWYSQLLARLSPPADV